MVPAVRRYFIYREISRRIRHREKCAISFISLAPDHILFSVEAFRKYMNDILVHEGGILLNY